MSGSSHAYSPCKREADDAAVAFHDKFLINYKNVTRLGRKELLIGVFVCCLASSIIALWTFKWQLGVTPAPAFYLTRDPMIHVLHTKFNQITSFLHFSFLRHLLFIISVSGGPNFSARRCLFFAMNFYFKTALILDVSFKMTLSRPARRSVSQVIYLVFARRSGNWFIYNPNEISKLVNLNIHKKKLF